MTVHQPTILSLSDIETMESRVRANLINGISGFKSANLVGTQNPQGQHNLAIVNSVFHLGAHPPLLGMIIRPHTVPRDTLENIIQTGVYTLNHIHPDIVPQAHQTSARYAAQQSEFSETGLTPFYSASMSAPYVAQSHVKIGMKLEEIQHLAVNGTELVIGRIQEIIVNDSKAIHQDGFVDLEALQSVAISGLDRYHSTQSLGRFAYAKPETKPHKISQ